MMLLHYSTTKVNVPKVLFLAVTLTKKFIPEATVVLILTLSPSPPLVVSQRLNPPVPVALFNDVATTLPLVSKITGFPSPVYFHRLN